jgi:peroxiredoxin family protein
MAEILVWVLIVAAVAVGVGALVALWRTLAGLKRLQGERE